MTVVETPRLLIRRLALDDAAFIVELLNDPDFIRNIADRGVRTIADARQYLLNGPIASYARHGYGLFLVTERSGGQAVGMCGLVKRDSLPEADVGYAFLPAYRGRGYAIEAACAILRYARERLGLRRVLAVTQPANARSIAVLHKLGMRFERPVQLGEDAERISLYASDDAPLRERPSAPAAAPDAGRTVILVIGSAQPLPEHAARALELSLQHVRRSRAEPGCLAHAVHHDAELPLRLVFVEEWADQAALTAHFTVPESRQFARELTALCAAPPRIDLFRAEPLAPARG